MAGGYCLFYVVVGLDNVRQDKSDNVRALQKDISSAQHGP